MGTWAGSLVGERWVRPGPSQPQQTPLLQALEDTSSSYPFALPPCPGNTPAGFFGPEAQRNLECHQAREPPGGPWPLITAPLSAPLCPQPLSGDDSIMDSGASSWGCQQGPRSQSAPCSLISLLSLPSLFAQDPPHSPPEPPHPAQPQPENEADGGCCLPSPTESRMGAGDGAPTQLPSLCCRCQDLGPCSPLPCPWERRRLHTAAPPWSLGTQVVWVLHQPFHLLGRDSDCSAFQALSLGLVPRGGISRANTWDAFVQLVSERKAGSFVFCVWLLLYHISPKIIPNWKNKP